MRKWKKVNISWFRRFLRCRSWQASKTYAYAYDLLVWDSWNLRNREKRENRLFSNSYTKFDLGLIYLRREYWPSTKTMRKWKKVNISRFRRFLRSRSWQASKTYAYAYDLLVWDSWNLRNRQKRENRLFSNFYTKFDLGLIYTGFDRIRKNFRGFQRIWENLIEFDRIWRIW